MNYQEWNNCIAQYFFNPENAGKDVRLYITKEDVIKIGRKEVSQFTESAAWTDFINAIQSGLPGTRTGISLIEKAKYSYDQWKRPGLKSIQNIPVTTPLYIGYLIFFILPLTEDAVEFHGRDYYGPLNSFLKANNINESINSLRELELLWEDLEEWSIMTMNGDAGFFTLGKFSSTFKYVGKPFSQCIISPNTIKRLPEFFFAAGMVPNALPSDHELKYYLTRFGASVLGMKNNILEVIKKSDSDELGHSIIQLVRKEYGKWKGESHELIANGTAFKTKRNYTVAPLLLQFKMNTNDGEIDFSFRMYSSNDYPEDLCYNGHEILSSGKGGYSNAINLAEKTNLVPFDLKDDRNKWIARFPRKDVRLFINGSFYQLSADYWIETDTLSKTERMFLLCRNEVKDKIENWRQTFSAVDMKAANDFDGLPQDCSLYSLINPKASHPDIPVLTVYSEKSIALANGLKINHRTFTNDILPSIVITNADGKEKVYLQYRNHEDKIYLRQKQSINNCWVLPEGIVTDVEFHLRVEDETLSGNEVAYTIKDTSNSAVRLDQSILPKRDSFGRKTNNELEQYSIGSNIVGANIRRQEAYKQFFRGIFEDNDVDISQPVYEHSGGNSLLAFLSYKRKNSTEDFYEAFQFLHSTYLGTRTQNPALNYSKIKKASLNMYDYLGYLDYDYEEKEIVVNPPQLILIPASKGRKALLIGGRDKAFVETLINLAPHYNLKVEVTKQSSLNENLLLPDAITIKAFGNRTENYGENNLRTLAEHLGIAFHPHDLVQVAMQQFSADIDQYEKDLLEKNEVTQTDYDWARKIFNPDNLRYEWSVGENFDKTFSLVEYKLNEYTYYNRLWKNQKCYQIDKNWGKYLALKHFGKSVILYDSKKNKVAIPLELPLPRLLAESIMLLSGLAPVYAQIESKAYRIYENVPGPFIKNLFDKLKQETKNYNL